MIRRLVENCEIRCRDEQPRERDATRFTTTFSPSFAIAATILSATFSPSTLASCSAAGVLTEASAAT